MIELNEQSLREAMEKILTDQAEKRANNLIVTEEGIAWMQHRIDTERDFRAMIVNRADTDAYYARFLRDIGIDLGD